ncbi:MAG: hypothetical protein AAF196_09110 [Planctomycetota bacterium]
MKAPLTDRMARCLIEIARDGIEFRGYRSWRSVRDSSIEFYNQTVESLGDRGLVERVGHDVILDASNINLYGRRALAESCRRLGQPNPLEGAA